MTKKNVILTGDRPTGPLHLGHFVGSLQNRVNLQTQHTQYIMIADVQALASNVGQSDVVRKNIMEVTLDYLAVGIDPTISTIFIQSMIPEIAELAIYFLNLVTVAHLMRNPTIKEEAKQKGYDESMPVGFLVHPVHQAADILIFNAQCVPVGKDQLPLIEQAVDIARKFNNLYEPLFVEPQALIPEHGARLMGIDGKAKMSKSLGNAIYLKDSADELTKKIMSMYTDPHHIHVNDPGTVEGNVVFAYLDIFDTNTLEVEELKNHYRRGGLGDMVIKKRLNVLLQDILTPIRTKRQELEKDMGYIEKVLHDGTQKARSLAQEKMHVIKKAMKIAYF